MRYLIMEKVIVRDSEDRIVQETGWNEISAFNDRTFAIEKMTQIARRDAVANGNNHYGVLLMDIENLRMGWVHGPLQVTVTYTEIDRPA